MMVRLNYDDELKARALTDSGRGWCKAILDGVDTDIETVCRQHGIRIAPEQAGSRPFRLRVADDGDVGPAARDVVAKVAGDCIAERGIAGVVKLVFVRPEGSEDDQLRDSLAAKGFGVPWQSRECDDEDLLGFYDEAQPDRVFVRSDLREAELVTATSHEIFHLSEKRRFPDVAINENLAHDYSSRYLDYWLNGRFGPWGRQ